MKLVQLGVFSLSLPSSFSAENHRGAVLKRVAFFNKTIRLSFANQDSHLEFPLKLKSSRDQF